MKVVENSSKLSEYFAKMKCEVEHEVLKGYYNINKKMEDIVCQLLNLAFGYNLYNKNTERPNFPAIDLADDARRVCVQVTFDNSLSKINKTIETFVGTREKLSEKYDRLVFFMLAGRDKSLDGRHIKKRGIKFDVNKDIMDYDDIIRATENLTNEKLYPLVQFIEDQYVNHFKVRLDEIQKRLPDNVVEPFIKRKIAPLAEYHYIYRNEGKDAADVLEENNRLVLLSEAGKGKTEEAKRIVNTISRNERYTFPFYKSLRTYTDQKIEDLVPLEYREIPPQNLVFVFDGLDEVDEKCRTTFIKNLEEFCIQNSGVRIIVTCRNNFYKQFSKGAGSTLSGFKEYIFCSISLEDINALLEAIKINTESFWNELKKKGLTQLIYNPFYLNKVITIYKEKQTLPYKKELLDEIIYDSFILDGNKYKNSSVEIEEAKTRMMDLLSIIGLSMEFMGKNFLKEEEYQQLINNAENRRLIKYSSVWGRNEEGNWSFTHNNFGEYLAAKRISEYSIDDIKRLICYENTERIRATWVNTLSFLVNKYRDKALIDWLINSMPEFISYIEEDVIDNSIRQKIFRLLFENCKKKKTWLSHIVISADLICTKSDIEFLISEIKSNSHPTTVGNALRVLGGSGSLYGMEDEVKSLLMEVCLSVKYTNYNKECALENLADFKLGNLDELRKIIVVNDKEEDSQLRKSYFYYCNKAKIVSDGIDIFLDRYNVVKGVRATFTKEDEDDEVEPYYFNEQLEYEQGFGLIDKESGIKKVIDFLESTKIRHRELNEKIVTSFCDSIFRTCGATLTALKYILKLYLVCERDFHDYCLDIINKTVKGKDKKLDFFKLYMKADRKKRFRSYELIIDDECMEYFYHEYVEGKYSDEIANDILVTCMNTYKCYNKIKEMYEERTGVKISNREIIDYNKIMRESTQKFFDNIFDRKKFFEFVDAFLMTYGNGSLTVEEIRGIKHERISRDSIYSYLADFLSFRVKDEGIINTDSLAKWDWDFFILSKAHALLNGKEQVSVSGEQQRIIEGLCNKNLAKVDFRNAIEYKEKGSYSTNSMCIYLWFFRCKFDLAYPEDILIDMLEFEWVTENGSLGIGYIEENAPKRKVNERIIENIKTGRVYLEVLKNHLDYCIRNNIESCVEAVSTYLLNTEITESDRMNAYNYIISFISVSEFVARYFYSLDENFKKQLISNVIERDSVVLREWLLENLKSAKEINDQMMYAKHLITIQAKEGLMFYYMWAVENNKTYKSDMHSGINAALATIHDAELLEYLVKFVELTLKPGFKDKDFSGIYYCAKQSIVSIAQQGEAEYLNVGKMLEKVIHDNSEYEKIGAISYLIEEVEQAYYNSRLSPPRIGDVKKELYDLAMKYKKSEEDWV